MFVAWLRTSASGAWVKSSIRFSNQIHGGYGPNSITQHGPLVIEIGCGNSSKPRFEDDSGVVCARRRRVTSTKQRIDLLAEDT